MRYSLHWWDDNWHQNRKTSQQVRRVLDSAVSVHSGKYWCFSVEEVAFSCATAGGNHRTHSVKSQSLCTDVHLWDVPSLWTEAGAGSWIWGSNACMFIHVCLFVVTFTDVPVVFCCMTGCVFVRVPKSSQALTWWFVRGPFITPIKHLLLLVWTS